MRLGQNWLQRVCCTKNFSGISLALSRLPLSFALCILISELLSNLKRCDTNWKWRTFSSKAEIVLYCHIQHISEGATFTLKAKALWFHFHILATTWQIVCQCLQPSCHLPCNLLVNKIFAHDSVNSRNHLPTTHGIHTLLQRPGGGQLLSDQSLGQRTWRCSNHIHICQIGSKSETTQSAIFTLTLVH